MYLIQGIDNGFVKKQQPDDPGMKPVLGNYEFRLLGQFKYPAVEGAGPAVIQVQKGHPGKSALADPATEAPVLSSVGCFVYAGVVEAISVQAVKKIGNHIAGNRRKYIGPGLTSVRRSYKTFHGSAESVKRVGEMHFKVSLGNRLDGGGGDQVERYPSIGRTVEVTIEHFVSLQAVHKIEGQEFKIIGDSLYQGPVITGIKGPVKPLVIIHNIASLGVYKLKLESALNGERSGNPGCSAV